MAVSPYQVFSNWLFDGMPNSPLPRRTEDVDILKYNSPITNTYVVSLFLRNGKLNNYLNTYFNDINLRYLDKEDLFRFIKKCIQDFRIKKRDLMFYKRTPKVVLYEILRDRMPILKNDDIYLLCDIIEKSENRDSIFESLGLEKPKKIKVKSEKKSSKKNISLDELLSEHFSIMEQK